MLFNPLIILCIHTYLVHSPTRFFFQMFLNLKPQTRHRLLWLLRGSAPKWRRCCKFKLCTRGVREHCCCKGSGEHYWREHYWGEFGALLFVALGEWENNVAFKSATTSKARLCEEWHCKRSKAKLQQERCYKKNVVDVSLLHVFFLFLCSYTSFFFPYKLAEKRWQWVAVHCHPFFLSLQGLF